LFEIKESNFSRNKAYKGGAINFDLYPPLVSKSSFLENEASSGYGKDISSYPVKLALVEQP